MRAWLVVVALLAALAGFAAPAGAQDAGIPVGSKAPVVSVHDLDGKPVDLGQYIGRKPVLLEFWATWCERCEELLPRVKTAYQEFGKQVEFLGVNVTINQTPERVRRYLAEHQPPYRTLYDDQGTTIRAYGVPTTSYVVVVDAGGKVAYTGVGGTQDIAGVLRRVVAH
jgi:thiol-disulfide isomerase/thioredoxin